VASPAALKYKTASNTARTLRETATDPRLQPISRSQTQVYYHSALAAFVAVWDAYINELVRNFFAATANPLDPKFHAVHSIARDAAERALERFNTPNCGEHAKPSDSKHWLRSYWRLGLACKKHERISRSAEAK
jgi:hypothetical protein